MDTLSESYSRIQYAPLSQKKKKKKKKRTFVCVYVCEIQES